MWKLKKRKKLKLPFRLKKEEVKGEPFYYNTNNPDKSLLETLSEIGQINNSELRMLINKAYFTIETKTFLRDIHENKVR